MNETKPGSAHGESHAVLWLIRHGETEWSATRRHTGRTDIPLTETGRHQARALGRHLAPKTFARVFTSPSSRAVETCQLAGFGAVAETNPDMMEWDYGVFEGRTTNDIRVGSPGWSIWTTTVEGGESADQVGERADRVIERALGTHGPVALFAHAHFLRILTARWLGLPAVDGRLFALGTASISVLDYERETRVISVWNQDWHLTRDERA